MSRERRASQVKTKNELSEVIMKAIEGCPEGATMTNIQNYFESENIEMPDVEVIKSHLKAGVENGSIKIEETKYKMTGKPPKVIEEKIKEALKVKDEDLSTGIQAELDSLKEEPRKKSISKAEEKNAALKSEIADEIDTLMGPSMGLKSGAKETADDTSGAKEKAEGTSGAPKKSADTSGAPQKSADTSGAQKKAADTSGAQKKAEDTNGGINKKPVSGQDKTKVTASGVKDMAIGSDDEVSKKDKAKESIRKAI